MTGEEPFQSFAMCWNMSLGIACTGVSLMEKGLFPSIVSVFLSSGFWIKTISVLTHYPCPIRCQDPASRQSCTLKTVVKNRKATIPWEKRPLFPKNTRYPINYGNICKTMLTSIKRRETVLVLDCAIMTVWPEHCRHAITRTDLKSLSHRDAIKTRDG